MELKDITTYGSIAHGTRIERPSDMTTCPSTDLNPTTVPQTTNALRSPKTTWTPPSDMISAPTLLLSAFSPSSPRGRSSLSSRSTMKRAYPPWRSRCGSASLIACRRCRASSMLEARLSRAVAPEPRRRSKILEGDGMQAGRRPLGVRLQRGTHVDLDQAECCAKSVP